MSSAITVRQQLALRPGSLYGTEPRSLAFGRGSLFSFPLHSTAYEADAATVRIPAGIKLRLTSASVDRKEMGDFLRTTGKAANGGVSLRFSSEENGDMIPVCTFDGERSGELSQTGLGIEGVLLRGFFVFVIFLHTGGARCAGFRRFISGRGPGLRFQSGGGVASLHSGGPWPRERPSTEVPTPLPHELILFVVICPQNRYILLRATPHSIIFRRRCAAPRPRLRTT